MQNEKKTYIIILQLINININTNYSLKNEENGMESSENARVRSPAIKAFFRISFFADSQRLLAGCHFQLFFELIR